MAKEWTDNFIEVGKLREMISTLDDDDMITVRVVHNAEKGDHKILGLDDTTCIGFWELRCE